MKTKLQCKKTTTDMYSLQAQTKRNESKASLMSHSRHPSSEHFRLPKFAISTGSAVQIFDILNWIVTSVFDSTWNKYNYSKFSNTYHH